MFEEWVIATRRVIVLGSTGSIGRQTIEVINHLNTLAAANSELPDYKIVALAAGSNEALLAQQAEQLGVLDTTLAAKDPGGAERLVRSVDADMVVAAIVGIAGLAPTLAAAELGRTIVLANKESLVAGGALVMGAARRTGAVIHPIDSEHAAAWMCLRSLAGIEYAPPQTSPPLRRLVLTASGGPFREKTLEQVATATASEALRHPTWSMGRKVTIDSATLTNKALELIEAHWLFGLPVDKLTAVIHPQSMVHAMIEAPDGSVLAHMAPPDMRLPIQLGMTAPDIVTRFENSLCAHEREEASGLDLRALSQLEFFDPDLNRWPVLRAARQVMESGGVTGAVLNGANEAAVRAFLDDRIAFGQITELSLAALDAISPAAADSLDAVLEADQAGRAFVESKIAGF